MDVSGKVIAGGVVIALLLMYLLSTPSSPVAPSCAGASCPMASQSTTSGLKSGPEKKTLADAIIASKNAALTAVKMRR